MPISKTFGYTIYDTQLGLSLSKPAAMPSLSVTCLDTATLPSPIDM